MIVVCNGGYRSGSTLAFMIVQRIFEAAGVPYRSVGCDPPQLTTLLDVDQIFWDWTMNGVVKCHYAKVIPPRAHVRYIMTYRNPFAAAASMRRLRPELGDEEIVKELRDQRDYRDRWRGRWDIYYAAYEDLYWHKASIVRQIAATMSMPVSPEQIKNIAEELEPQKMFVKAREIPQGGMDEKTHLRHAHLSQDLGHPEAWRTTLPVRMIGPIEREVLGIQRFGV